MFKLRTYPFCSIDDAYFPAGSVYGEIWLDLVNDVTWAHSGKDATFTHWQDGEPRSDAEACAGINKSGGWFDVYCYEIEIWNMAYLCELP